MAVLLEEALTAGVTTAGDMLDRVYDVNYTAQQQQAAMGTSMASTPMDHLNQTAFAVLRNLICVLSIVANSGSIVSLRYCKKPGPLHAKLLG